MAKNMGAGLTLEKLFSLSTPQFIHTQTGDGDSSSPKTLAGDEMVTPVEQSA